MIIRLRIAQAHDHDLFVAVCDTLGYAKTREVVTGYAEARIRHAGRGGPSPCAWRDG
jgi:hypothetical protein